MAIRGNFRSGRGTKAHAARLGEFHIESLEVHEGFSDGNRRLLVRPCPALCTPLRQQS